MAPAPRDPSVGAPPYRDAPLTPPQPPPNPRPAVRLASGAFAALCVLRLLFARATTTPPPPALYIENATSLAGGPRITAVFSDRDTRRRAVLRVPGAAVKRGTDTVVAPEVIAAHGAVAAAPDGEHLVDEHGELLRVRDGVVAPLPGVEIAPFPVGELLPEGARVLQRAGEFARMDNGALHAFRGAGYARPELADRWLVRDVATDGEVVCALGRDDRVRCARSQHWEAPTGLNTPDTWAHPVWVEVEPLAGHGAEQVVTGGGVACVRERGGGVFCARLSLPRRGEEMAQRFQNNVPLPLTGDAPRATAVAIGRDDLCVLGVDGHLWCVHGPQEDAVRPLAETPLRLHDAMDGVAEVGLTERVGCARRGGRIDCWGALARGGWVTARDRPVSIDLSHEVTDLVAHEGLVCALRRGVASCWGMGQSRNRHPLPVPVPVVGSVTRLASTIKGVCALGPGSPRCWLDVTDGAVPPEPVRVEIGPWSEPAEPLALPARPAEVPGVFARTSLYQCALLADGGVACGTPTAHRAATDHPRVPGLEAVAKIVMTEDGLACALQGRGDVWCWHDNTSGALTAAEAARAPRVVTLRR